MFLRILWKISIKTICADSFVHRDTAIFCDNKRHALAGSMHRVWQSDTYDCGTTFSAHLATTTLPFRCSSSMVIWGRCWRPRPTMYFDLNMIDSTFTLVNFHCAYCIIVDKTGLCAYSNTAFVTAPKSINQFNQFTFL